MTNKPFFSIIIPTLNEEKYLPLLLKDLSEQTNRDFEVIHVDGNSEDKTLIEAKKFEKKLNLQTITSKIKNVSHQRNLGAKHAKGTWVIFMDADNRLPTYFLDGIKYKVVRNTNIDLFTTWIKIDENLNLNKTIEKTINFSFELQKSIGKETAFGAMIGVKRDLVIKFPFDEKQKVMEDVIFIQNLIKNKYTFKIFKDPKYTFSFRRPQSEGIIKTLKSNLKVAYNYYIEGNDFSNANFGYEMNGGNSYEKSDEAISKILFNIEKFIKTQPKTQFKQTKKIFESIKNSF